MRRHLPQVSRSVPRGPQDRACSRCASQPPHPRGVPMSIYSVPTRPARLLAGPKTVYLIPSGDLRESANIAGWSTQQALERVVSKALAEQGWTVIRALEVDPVTGHGF